MSWTVTLQRLKERKLVQWALAYLAGAWVLIQVVHLLGEQFSLPAALPRSITVVLGIGFFAVLVIAWYHGEKGAQRVSTPELLMLSALLVIAGGAVWLVAAPSSAASGTGPGSGPPGRAPGAVPYAASVAVLPFENRGGGEENEYFSEGITDEIIGQLALIEGLKVISRTSVVALKGTRLTLPQIADTLGVRHVLEGSVRRVGDRVRVSAQLIDPQTDTHLWAETFDRELTDIFRVQEEIARQVSNALLSRVDGLRPRAAGSRTDQTAAYDAYLRGTFANQRRSPEGLLNAMAAFEEAIGLDSTYAPAYAGLATAHALWVVFGYRGERSAYSHIVRALAFADRAVSLDSTLAEAYAARGGARRQALIPVQSVLADVQRAARLAPNAGEVRAMYALGLAYAGNYEAAVGEAESAVALDPLSPGRRSALAATLYAARRHEDALREARRAESLAPGFPLPLRQQAQALLLLGRYQECATMDVGPYLAFRAMCRWSAGAGAEAEAIIDSLAAAISADAHGSAIESGVLASEIANYYAWVGDVDGTIRWLRRAAEASPQVPFQLTMDGGLYDRVLETPRFRSEWDRIRREIRARVEGAKQ